MNIPGVTLNEKVVADTLTELEVKGELPHGVIRPAMIDDFIGPFIAKIIMEFELADFELPVHIMEAETMEPKDLPALGKIKSDMSYDPEDWGEYGEDADEEVTAKGPVVSGQEAKQQ